MIASLQSSCTSCTEINVEDGSSHCSQCCEVECVTKSGMVVGERLSEELNVEEIRIEKWTEDASSSSKDSDDEDDCQSEIGQEIVAPVECDGSFGNIEVKNSSDVHFGNNTYHQYQGPVTIKQFVYKGENSDRKLPIENGGTNNFRYLPEIVTQTDEECSKKHDNQNVQNVVNEDKKNNIESNQGTRWPNKLYKKRKLLAICLSIVFIILLIVIFLSNKKEDILSEWSDESNLSGELKIIARKEWSAESPKDEQTLSLPVPNVIISDTATESCTNRGKCTQHVRYLQYYQMMRQWSDIAYNFLVGGDAYVYEGRGWEIVGRHSFLWNPKSIGISFIGTFDNILPPKQQILAAKMLIEEGVKNNYIAQDYKLYTYRQIESIPISPGDALYENIKTWEHWTNKSQV